MLCKIRDIYDQVYWVDEVDFHNVKRYPRLVPLRDTTGRKIEYRLEPVNLVKGAYRSPQSHIHRENVTEVCPPYFS